MKKLLSALLCLLVLSVPVSGVTETTEASYSCDACGYEGPFSIIVTGTETRDGAPGECYSIQCPECGAPAGASWRQTGPAEAPPPPKQDSGDNVTAETHNDPDPQPESPAQPETPQQPEAPQQPETPQQPEAPAQPETPQQPEAPQQPETPAQPAAPEEPADVPQEPAAEDSGNGGNAPAVPQQENASPPSGGGELPPVPEAPSSGSGDEGRPGGEPAPQDAVNDTPPAEPPANPGRPAKRNIRKYPYFSAVHPSRRLNLEGDPDALAPVPGARIYPAEGSSILRHMLDGD